MRVGHHLTIRLEVVHKDVDILKRFQQSPAHEQEYGAARLDSPQQASDCVPVSLLSTKKCACPLCEQCGVLCCYGYVGSQILGASLLICEQMMGQAKAPKCILPANYVLFHKHPRS